MTRVQSPIKFTYRDYRNLPESERERFELLGGELVMVPAPVPYHQIVSRNLEQQLWDFVRRRQLGELLAAPCDVVLTEDVVVQPDLFFISKQRTRIIGDEGVHGAPDLVVEILSPSTAERDRTFKRTLYAKYGVREYWLVDPDSQTIEVFILGARGYRQAGLYEADEKLKSPLLPGLEISLEEVFTTKNLRRQSEQGR